jgi:hypothetical protein
MPTKKPRVTKPSSKKMLANKSHDALDAKVALDVKLEQHGVSIQTRSRAIAAFDRLVGATVGWLAEYAEGKRRETQARAEGREALIRAMDAAALRLLQEQDELGKARLENFLRNEYRKQDNHLAVASYAMDDLLNAPPSSPKTSDTEEAPSGGESPSLDEDWMNLFCDYAARASSERMREQWGRILAGEIRKSGSFSFSTLRVMAEMDRDIAMAFQDVYRLSINGHVLKPSLFGGVELEKFSNLEAFGLVQEGFNIGVKVNANEDGFGYVLGNDLLLRVTYMPGNTTLHYLVIMITRIGREIGSILPRDEREALRQIGLSMVGAKKIELGSLDWRAGNDFSFQILETLFEKP